MNTKFMELFLEERKASGIPLVYYKSQRFNNEKYCSVYGKLQTYMNNNSDKKLYALSMWCLKIDGMQYKAVLLSLATLGITGKTHLFMDEDYLSHDEYREVIIPKEELAQVAKFFGVTTEENRKAIKNSAFSLFDYKQYIIKRQKSKTKYTNDYSFDGISYFNKDFVAKHKFPFLETFVEENKRNITDGERCAKEVLEKMGVRYEFQKSCLVGGKIFIMDFYLEDFGICLEIDGEYHDTLEQLKRDRQRTNLLAKSGVLVVRFTNEEAMNGSSIETYLRLLFNEL